MVKHIGTASSQSQITPTQEAVTPFVCFGLQAMSPNLPGSPYFFAMMFPKKPNFVTPYYIYKAEPLGGGMWNQKLDNQHIDIHLNFN